ncbi:MAG TPA: hypothetical protein VHC42_02475 [Rhizomicrobium sp.]|nr:hypothetical protein [Rhizomicrobium sp.]
MFSRSRSSNANGEIGARLERLRSDLDALQGDIQSLAAEGQDGAADRFVSAIGAAGGLAQRALKLAEDLAAGMAGDVEHWTADNLHSARARVRAQPLSALAVTFGVGALVGAMLLRR